MPGIIFLVFLPLGLALLRLGNPGIVTEVGQLTQNLGCRDLKRCTRIFGLHKHFGVLMITNSSRSRSEPSTLCFRYFWKYINILAKFLFYVCQSHGYAYHKKTRIRQNPLRARLHQELTSTL